MWLNTHNYWKIPLQQIGRKHTISSESSNAALAVDASRFISSSNTTPVAAEFDLM